MESKLSEVNQIANRSQLQLEETTQCIKSLEERQKSSEVRTFNNFLMLRLHITHRSRHLVQILVCIAFTFVFTV